MKFYNTLHEVMKTYTGNNKQLQKYVKDQKNLVFKNIYGKQDKDGVVAYTYTNQEYNAIKLIEAILPEVFSYKFYSLMKIGMINLYKDQGNIKCQPVKFDKSLLMKIMNKRMVKSISTSNPLELYQRSNFVKLFDSIITSILVFGHLTTVNVDSLGTKVIYTRSQDKILSGISESGNFQHQTNENKYSDHYGELTIDFLSKYHIPSTSRDIRVRENIIGKTAIMKGFNKLLETRLSPRFVELAGIQLGIDAFRDNPEVWSEKAIKFAMGQIFEKLINPEKDGGATWIRDPILHLVQVYTASQNTKIYKIASGNLRGATKDFWSSNFGKLTLTYPTLTQYFGKDFFKIQPSLRYREYNIREVIGTKDLDLNGLLTSEFIHKVQHLYNNFYTVLSQNYKDGEQIKATFHIEKSLGLGDKTKIFNSLPAAMKTKFNALMGTGQNSLSLTIRKDANGVINDAEFREFISSITFYLVMFNAFVAIGDDSSGYKLFASQRKIYNNDFITGLYAKDNSKYKLNPEGLQILNNWAAMWNQEGGRIVWNYEDCWPIYLLDDALDLVNEDVFRDGVRALER